MKKRGLLLISLFFVLSLAVCVVSYSSALLDAGRIPADIGSHELRLISNGSQDSVSGLDYSADANENGIVDMAEDALAAVKGEGTLDSIPKFSGSKSLTDSIMYESAGSIGIGGSDPEIRLDTGTGETPLMIRADNDLPSASDGPYIRTGGGGSLQINSMDKSGPSGQYGHFYINPDVDSDIFIAVDPAGTATGGRVGIGTTNIGAGIMLRVEGNVQAYAYSGDGSALTDVDAETLDGQDGAYYLDNTDTWITTQNCPVGQYLSSVGKTSSTCSTPSYTTDTWITTQTCPVGQYLSSVGKTSKTCTTPSYTTDTWITTQTCPVGQYLSSVGKTSKTCTTPSYTTDTNAKTLCADNAFLRGDGSTVCRTAAQIVIDGNGLTSESDPQVDSVINGRICRGDVNGYVDCDRTAAQVVSDGGGLMSETDPQVGTLTNAKWCTSNGIQVHCDTDAPSRSSLDASDGFPADAFHINQVGAAIAEKGMFVEQSLQILSGDLLISSGGITIADGTINFLDGAVSVYSITNQYCSASGGLTTSSTCSTRSCDSFSSRYYNCVGNCRISSAPYSCDNTYLGKLVP